MANQRSRLTRPGKRTAGGAVSQAAGAALQAAGVPAPVGKLLVKTGLKHKKAVLIGGALAGLGPVVPIVFTVVLIVTVVFGLVVGNQSTFAIPANTTAKAEIPAHYLEAYEAAGNSAEVPWPILAAIGTIATGNGTRSPYDKVQRTTTYPTVQPPIGGVGGEAAGPMLVDGAVANQVTHGHPQSVAESVAAVASTLFTAANAVAAAEHVDYTTMFTEPVAQNSGFWETAINHLDVAVPKSCTPTSGQTVAVQIEAIWSCEMVGKNVQLQMSPWATTDQATAGQQLIAEALDVAWAYSHDGTSRCAVFPLPSGTIPNPCDTVANIEAAAKLVIAAATTSIGTRSAPAWSVLPGVDPQTAPPAPASSHALNQIGFSSASVPSQACASDLTGALSSLPEPGPFSPGFPGGPPPTNAAALWTSSTVAKLASNPVCETAAAGGLPAAMSAVTWEETVAVAASEALTVGELADGGTTQLTDLSGLVTYLVSATAMPTAVFGKNAVVPRLSNPPAVIDPPPLTTPLPLATTGGPNTTVSLIADVGFAAQVVSTAASFEQPGGTHTDTAVSGAAAGAIPPGWVQWAQEATAANCPGLSPTVLLAIGEVETTWGTSSLPGVHSGANYAGAEGPMQFEPATFAQYATSVPNQPPNIYDPQDALFAAAKMLCADGAPANLSQAIFAYNHASWYVREVLADAQKLSATTTAATIPGQAGKLVSAAMAQLGVPYAWGAQNPGSGFDCSGLVDWALQKAGYQLSGLGTAGSHGDTAQELYNLTASHPAPSPLAPGDLVFFGASTATVQHVGIYIGGGEMVDAPNASSTVRTEPYTWPDFLGATKP